MARLTWLPEALGDLARLLAFLQEKNPQAAMRAAKAIARAADRLAASEGLGRPMADGTGRRELFIPFASNAYVLRYRLEEDASVVIIRVWHGREGREEW
ncbi:type II toxin-antitoxin system RelE/ParE family toxin [Pseudoroseomonas globiformis]|uniref:Type II toxin-antitoxin system RelE/ParE family toxin n=1 Tax=Teichococcus globiformis TaxID=2307229 RepID=A0ABV7GBG6_9PROT